MFGLDPTLSMERFIGALRYSFQKKGKEVYSVVHHDKHKMRVRESPAPTPAPVPVRKYYVMSRFRCSDHVPSGEGPELIQPIRVVPIDECLSLCDMEAECTHITLYRSDNKPTADCWLSRGEYVDSKDTTPVSRPLQIDSGFGWCISTTPAPPPPASAGSVYGSVGDSGLEEESESEGGNGDGGAPIAIIAAAGAGAVLLLLGAICYVRKQRKITKSVVSDPHMPSPEMSRQATENPNMEDDPTTIGKKPDEDNPNLDNPILEHNKVSSAGSATGHPTHPEKVCAGCAPGQGGKFEGANFCPVCGRRS
eukprot:gnl/MRDRNA2_/MRDRNA2_81328_c0_seq3.p1 gnl/MRDRNA2_/MRDRNA2_81328_c0~~gnl/MRDRNA2_/MRDRNA2_81328_c0_seq3.p1  ORF type:complete len:308 (+),score=43.65 gnl/MRDRNA2_/MRDRNA2_81328_c0_seq3:77-1000(+)